MTAEAPAPALAELRAAATAATGPGAAEDYLELLRGSPGALYRGGGPHHLTASAVVIDAPAEHVALVWHRKGRFWVQPGGHLEQGETSFERAARREVAEEIGVTALERLGPGPAVLHRHLLDTAFGACAEHWDVQYLLRADSPAAALPLHASEESPEVRWVPWPLRGAGPERSTDALPEGTVADMPGKLDALAPYLMRYSA
ncbi:NUDIX hydrolase [Brachybacterium sacelli]|uniref:8-oxo-dGTP pyrophosphatase MutT (NUDIX family) n=1 Tax=Brachybacterium sacelli TaxID=173364 RepID=A0ABS4X1C0_9MICO|nr:8-oxo-dGTP pyrophosphatase MutT (NUDIX family) [Brachybacterium sacelli]